MARAGEIISDLTLVELLGQGNSAEVWKAKGPENYQSLKLVREDVFRPAQRRTALEALAKSLSQWGRIEHPALAGVYGVKTHDQEGIFGLAQEYLEGRSLYQLLSGGQLDIEDRLFDFLSIVERIAMQAHSLHQAGIVHGGLTAGNIILSERDPARSLIFVDLCWIHAGLGRPAPTSVAPELKRGGQLTPASDQWSVACLIHQAILASKPELSAAEALKAAPVPLLKVMQRAIDSDPRKRFGNLASFAQSLKQARDQLTGARVRRHSDPKAATMSLQSVQKGEDETISGELPSESPTTKSLVSAVKAEAGIDNTAEIPQIRDPSLAPVDIEIDSADGDDVSLRLKPELIRPQDPTDVVPIPVETQKSGSKKGLLWGAALVLCTGLAGGFYLSSNGKLSLDSLKIPVEASETESETSKLALAAVPPAEAAPNEAKKDTEEKAPVKAPPAAEAKKPAEPIPAAQKTSLVTTTKPQPKLVKPKANPCQKGYGRACLKYAAKLPKSRAVRIFEKACWRGNTSACYKAGSIRSQPGRAASGKKARKLLERACDRQHGESCVLLARLWRAGVGGPASERTADSFMVRACKAGKKSACR